MHRFKLLLPPGKEDSKALVAEKAFAGGVLALPGASFFAGGRVNSYVRASFSLLTPEETDEAIRRLASAVQAEWDAHDSKQ